MLTTFEELFGTYEPISSVISGSAIDGTAIYEYSTNFGYIAHAIFVLIIVYSIFRLIGILLGGVSK